MIWVGTTVGGLLVLQGELLKPMTESQACELAAKLILMANDINLHNTKEFISDFMGVPNERPGNIP